MDKSGRDKPARMAVPANCLRSLKQMFDLGTRPCPGSLSSTSVFRYSAISQILFLSTNQRCNIRAFFSRTIIKRLVSGGLNDRIP